MKKNNKNERQSVDRVLTPEETFEVMMQGTAVSCKLAKILTSTGSGHIGVCAAFYGLAKVTTLIEQLALRYGYDMVPFYQEIKDFWDEYAKTEEFEKSLLRHGFKKEQTN